MNKYYVNTTELEKSKSKFKNIKNDLHDSKIQIGKCKLLLCAQQGFGIENVRRDVNTLYKQVADVEEDMKEFADFLSRLISCVNEAEKDNVRILERVDFDFNVQYRPENTRVEDLIINSPQKDKFVEWFKDTNNWFGHPALDIELTKKYWNTLNFGDKIALGWGEHINVIWEILSENLRDINSYRATENALKNWDVDRNLRVLEGILKSIDEDSLPKEIKMFDTKQDKAIFMQFIKAYDATLGETAKKYFEFIDWSLFSLEQLQYIFGNYEADIKYLENLKAALSYSEIHNQNMLVAIDKLIEQYQNEFFASIQRTSDKIGQDVLKDLLKEEIPIYKIANLIANMSGFTDYSEDLNDIAVTTAQRMSFGSAFLKLHEKFSSGDYTAEDLEQYKTSFEFLKATAIKEYENIVKNTSDANIREEAARKLREIRSWGPPELGAQ